jgi:cell division protein FtsB
MRRATTLVVLFGFVIGLATGCGSSKLPATVLGNRDAAPNAGEAPKPIGKDDLPAAKAKLADLEKSIAAKEKELADLKVEADALRRRTTADREPPKDNVYRSPLALLADMPKNKFPKIGAEGGLERIAARIWCAEKLIGRTIEWTSIVTEVADSGGDPSVVKVKTDATYFLNNTFAFGHPISLGGQTCQVLVVGGRPNYGEYDLTEYSGCTAAEVATLRQLKGRQVSLRGLVRGVEVADSNASFGSSLKETVPIMLTVTKPTIDGFLPEAYRFAEK